MNLELVQIWQSITFQLLLIKTKSIEKKLYDLPIKIKDINLQHASAAAKQILYLKLDKLFDISPCSCMLEISPCNDKKINCNAEDYQEHILFACNSLG